MIHKLDKLALGGRELGDRRLLDWFGHWDELRSRRRAIGDAVRDAGGGEVEAIAIENNQTGDDDAGAEPHQRDDGGFAGVAGSQPVQTRVRGGQLFKSWNGYAAKLIGSH